ncbi:MAG: HAMP domain-containing histidine kinase [Anaerolineaceae bacterium]|nr:HAMP domain-containing histidine kinase [Anaerolineaceae bacterium]
MSLRLRLTLLYTTLLGGVLLIFGSLVYGLVSFTLLQQIDKTLASTAGQIVEQIRVGENNRFDPRTLEGYQPSETLVFQLWDQQGTLQVSYPARQREPLDKRNQNTGQPKYSFVQDGPNRIRILNVPLETPRGPAGILQVASSLSVVDTTLSTLASVLILLVMAAMFAAGLGAWLITDQALSPLAAVTQMATQITNADDLQRRIPQTVSPDDEIGELIQAFNQTLERLEQLFNTQRRFLTDVSHELRTPLTVIKGNIGLLRKLGESDEESLSSIEIEVDRLSRLVGDLLLLAQAESGRLPLAMLPVELDTVLLEVFQQMRILAGDRVGLKITEIDQVQVTGDRDRLKQVLFNLVSNAVQYTPRDGQVSLVLRRAGTRAQILVTDTGPGIPLEDLPHIFERFYRTEKSRRRTQGGGFGLGLSIAYWIVRNHGGTVEVTSREGKGTTFCVWLPLTPE